VRGPVTKSGLGATSPPSGKPGGVSRLGNHPYANAQPTLHPPSHQQSHNLSPIEEGFSGHHNSTPGTPSPPSQGYSLARGAYNQTPSWDDIKKKIVKFVIPEEGTSFTIDVTNCSRGQEVIEKVLKKVGKTTLRNPGTESPSGDRDDEYFNVDGWAVWQDSPDEGIGMLESNRSENESGLIHAFILRRAIIRNAIVVHMQRPRSSSARKWLDSP
jgi:mitogen-activated protein kinase kinase kinase